MRLVDRIPDLPPPLVHRAEQRVVVVGGGKTGAAAARLALAEGAWVHVVDDAPEAKLAAGLAAHQLDVEHPRLQLVGGGLQEDQLRWGAVVVLSPGVPRRHPAIAAILADGSRPIVSELEYALAVLADKDNGLHGLRLWGITGTNGKSTTTTIAGAIAAEVDAARFMGGNLGEPLAAGVLAGLRPGTTSAPRQVVLELSSYQLETLRFLPIRAAAVTNLAPDHLDRYPNVDAYYQAKAHLLDLVEVGGGVSLNANDALSQIHLAPRLRSDRASCHFDISVSYDASDAAALTTLTPQADVGSGLVIDVDALRVFHGGQPTGAIPLTNPRLVGHHNRQNAAAAVALALLAGLPLEACVRGVSAWGGIPHRLERLGTVDGLTWWNDSKATNVDATVTALRSFTNGGVHLIVGGVGKGSSYAPMVEAARRCCRSIYTIGADAPAIAAAVGDSLPVIDCVTLEAACAAIVDAAVVGDHLLLAPACASFDQFRDYVQRGERLRALYADAASAAAPSGTGAST